MKLVVCSVFDTKVGAYAAPNFFKTKGEAIRAFTDAVVQEGSPFGKHRPDYRFFCLGEFDDSTGQLTACVPEVLIGADEV